MVAVAGEATRLPNFAPKGSGVKSVTVPIRANMAAVFSVQHLFCSIRGNAILDSHSDPLGASLQKTGAGSFSKQSILRRPARPRERECSAGYFL